MNTDGIRLFVLAADRLNIRAADRQLGLAPAVASARLAKLAKQLGADLLHRSTRQVSLSLEGAEFLKNVVDLRSVANERLVDHSTINGWVIRFAPQLEAKMRSRKNVTAESWRMDARVAGRTYIKVKGKWQYLYLTPRAPCAAH